MSSYEESASRSSSSSSQAGAGGGPWWHESPAPDSGETFGTPSDSTEALMGAAAEEFVRLAGSVAQWADRTGVNATLRSFVDQAAQTIGTNSRCDRRVCNVCPICQGMAALSAARPELADSLIEVMTAMGELVHSVVQTLATGAAADTRAAPPDLDQP